ncbi:MAG: glycosyltransferase [Bacteroidales bacterium]|nr:glycosyltransferase [Bacteroidales bacterium]
MKKLITLCIPTNGRVDFVLPVLDSIYNQGIDDCLFEVVISDNGDKSVLHEAIGKYLNHDNIFYYKSKLKGFVNQVDALKHSNGLYIKMLNHRSVLLPGILREFIGLVEKYKDTQPYIFFSDGLLKGEKIIECTDFNSFVYLLSYYSSWSGGVGLWNKDKSKLDEINYNQMFPHTSIVFETKCDSQYVIFNKKFMDEIEEPNKGGYNLFHAFSVIYLDILKELENERRISSVTFQKIKRDLRCFLSDWYYNIKIAHNQYTFDVGGFREHISVYYSYADYMFIVLRAILKAVRVKIRK